MAGDILWHVCSAVTEGLKRVVLNLCGAVYLTRDTAIPVKCGLKKISGKNINIHKVQILPLPFPMFGVGNVDIYIWRC